MDNLKKVWNFIVSGDISGQHVNALNTVLHLTLLLNVITWHKSTYLMVISLTALVIGYLNLKACRSPLFWFLIAALQCYHNITYWYAVDNHIVVANYWSLAVAIALTNKNPIEIIRSNAQVMIGLIFFFATLWKAISMQYMSGAFFEFTFLLDQRFLSPLRLFSGLSNELIAVNYQLASELVSPVNITNSVTLNSTNQLNVIAHFTTWWTVIIEGVLAVLFLLSSFWKRIRLRNLLLFVFALTTYSIALVTGFATTLMVLGTANCKEEESLDQKIYLALFVLLILYTPLWHYFFYRL